MAAPSYTTDLVVASLAESTTGFSDINVAGGGGGGALSLEVDFAIQGSSAINRAITGVRTRGVFYDLGAATALDPDAHIFIWTLCATPGISATKDNGGVRIMAGGSTSAYSQWYVNGSDTLPQGGMQNYAIHTSSAASNTAGGGLSGNPQYIGSAAAITATAKGDNYCCDAIRYGTGFYITEGDATTPVTFSGSAAINDLNANRYGILTAVPGGFALKGKYVVGQISESAHTPSQAYFRESNTSLAITDTEYSLPDFTQIVFDHPSTDFAFNTVTFTTIGTNNRGKFMVNDASTTGSLISCTFNDFGNTVLNTNVQVTGSSWIGCNGVVQSGSIITTSNLIGTTDPSGSIISNDPSLITNCLFEGDGTHHGIEVVVTGSYSFSGNKFTGFVSGSNGGEELLFNPPGGTGDLTINIVGGGDNLEFQNLSSGTVTINNNIQVTLTGMKDFTEVRVLAAGTNTELAGIENVPSSSVGANDNDWPFSLAAGTAIDIAIISVQYNNQRIDNYTIPSADSEIPIQQTFDRNYSNPS